MDSAKRSSSPPKEAIPLPASAWDDIVEKLNQQGSLSLVNSPPTRRIYERRRYTKIVRCVLRMKQKEGPAAVYLVRSRNLSEGGLGFFFGSYMHPGTVCHFAIMGLDGQGQLVVGVVRWCRHVARTLHECGVQFDAPIQIESFLDPKTTPVD